MKNFNDRMPTQMGRRKITHEDGTSEFVTVELADEPTREGTPLNRAAMMAVQGFEAKTTVFNSDDSITETTSAGDIKHIVFPEDGSAVEHFYGTDGSSVTKTITFAETEVVETLSWTDIELAEQEIFAGASTMQRVVQEFSHDDLAEVTE